MKMQLEKIESALIKEAEDKVVQKYVMVFSAIVEEAEMKKTIEKIDKQSIEVNVKG